MSKKSTLQRWLERKKESTTAASTSTRSNRFPLSHGQQQLWLLQQLHGENPFYHYAETYELTGIIQPDLLKSAYQGVVERHSSLRTTFREDEDGQVQQFVHQEPVFDFVYRDLSQLGSEAKEKTIDQLQEEETNRPFSLSEGPLHRFVLVKTAPEYYRVLLILHHIITDKWSMRILREELGYFYRKELRRVDENLAPLSFQYGDFALEERAKPTKENDLDYWRKNLDGAPPLLNLPIDRPRPGSPSFRGRYVEQVLSEDLSEGLRHLASRLEVTMYHLLLAVYKVLISRYANQSDLLIGTPLTNRKQEKLERLIGYFNDTLVLRSQPQGDKKFIDYVREIKKLTLEAFTHNSVPFERLVKELNPKRDVSINPFFQAMFILNVAPPPPDFGEDIDLRVNTFDIGTTKFDLTLYVSEGAPELRVLFEYATDLFAEDTIRRMQDHLRILLREVVDHPENQIRDLSLLEPVSGLELSKAQNERFGYPASILLPFAQTVQSAPDATALTYEDEEITYGQLDKRSDGLAAKIQRESSGKSNVIGLCINRSIEQIIGILAILKAGAAYLPIDPEYPAERTSFILEDAEVDLIVTTPDISKEQNALSQLPLLFIEENSLSNPPESWNRPIVSPDDLAYLIYTSGSTGQPKGVMVTHGNLSYSTQARKEYYPSSPAAFLLLSSFAFDSSVAGIFWTLTSGGKLVLTPKRIEQDLEKLEGLIDHHKVTHTLMLPSLYGTFLRFVSANKLASLQAVIVAGEKCDREIGNLHQSLLPNANLYNEYGPTEATVWCTVHKIEDTKEGIPIGRPIPGAEIILLSSDGAMQPVGVPGELCVGGPGVSQGYLKREQLNEEKFFNKLVPGLSNRWYRTGDLAKFREDGRIDFLGRIDRQIKFRGYRIELEEIRAGILRVGSVKDAAIILSDKLGSLVAYFVPEADEVNKEDIVLALKKIYPDYMVPGRWIPLSEIPRLPNGKLNVNLLPEPSRQHTPGGRIPEAVSKNPVEALLVEIWEEVLQFTGVERFDNFFEIGGDSILSIQIVAKARKKGIELSPDAIFTHQTIAELAAQIEENRTENTQVSKTDPAYFELVKAIYPTSHSPRNRYQAFVASVASSADFSKIDAIWSSVMEMIPAFRSAWSKSTDGSWSPEVKSNGPSITRSSIPTLDVHEFIKEKIVDPDELTSSLHAYQVVSSSQKELDHLFLFVDRSLIDGESVKQLIKLIENLYHQDIPNVEGILPAEKWEKALDHLMEESKPIVEILRSTVNQNTESEKKGITPKYSSLRLSPEFTKNLLLANDAYNTAWQDLVRLALLETLLEQSGQPSLAVTLELDIRSILQEHLSPTKADIYGNFYVLPPVQFSVRADKDLGEKIMEHKERIRAVSSQILSNPSVLKAPEAPENFSAGEFGPAGFSSLDLRTSDASISPPDLTLREVSPIFLYLENPHKWWTEAMLSNQQLELRCSYHPSVNEASVNRLLTSWKESLSALVSHCLDQAGTTYTRSDFSELGDMNQDDLDQLLNQIDL